MRYDLIDVDTLQVGDRIHLRKLGDKLVAEVNRYEDTIVVVYFDEEDASYENRARDHSGFNRRRRLVYKSLIPLRPGDLLAVERGTPAAAAERRRELEQAQRERFEQAAQRQAGLIRRLEEERRP